MGKGHPRTGTPSCGRNGLQLCPDAKSVPRFLLCSPRFVCSPQPTLSLNERLRFFVICRSGALREVREKKAPSEDCLRGARIDSWRGAATGGVGMGQVGGISHHPLLLARCGHAVQMSSQHARANAVEHESQASLPRSPKPPSSPPSPPSSYSSPSSSSSCV